MGVSQLLITPSGGKKEINLEYQVFTVEPHVIVTNTPLDEPLPDHLGYSIFTMLCCCFPLGIAALVYSITTRDANQLGHRQIAEKNSTMARMLNNVSLAIGMIVILLVICYFIEIMFAQLEMIFEDQPFTGEMNMPSATYGY